ncbi:hypothetical protein H5410_061042 [Solanum commersonii]|uniref:CCHC-type domain-containing protein n=1 Tax=Solanum commersonii TaxID=4109 RepID=A0A9J5W7S3_SOLCO|nr:hypothetical protein H5410_061042 [Solanum commersonii]
MKNYHNRPSFLDLQYEENAFLSTSSHEGRGIIEWNIHGLAEHQIYNKLHEMVVAITAYKIRSSTDKEKSRSKRPRDSQKDVCWTCGKTGHKSSECRSNTTKKKINLLDIDEDNKDKLLFILDEPFSDSSHSSDEYCDDEDINLDHESDNNQSVKDCNCTEAFCTYDSTP